MEDKKYNKDELIIRFLAGEASPSELEELERWKSLVPENQTHFNSVEKTWNLVGKKPFASDLPIDVDQEWDKFKSESKVETPVITMASTWWVRIAAVFLLGIISAFVIYYYTTQSSNTYYAEVSGMEVSLADGSVVTLHKGSTLTVSEEFQNGSRDVSLTGEAFFEVEPSTLTFTVSLGTSTVQVVGTSFNIRNFAGESHIEVVVTTGKVHFTSNRTGEAVDLSPGDKGSMPADGRILKVKNDNVNYLSWKTRSIVFEDSRLSEAVEVLNRVYQANIRFDIPVPDCIVTVSFEDQTLEALLSVLSETMDLTLEYKKDNILITEAACQ